MMVKISYCSTCVKYTLQTSCTTCGENTISPHPPRFSPEDRYGKYRRRLKAMSMEE